LRWWLCFNDRIPVEDYTPVGDPWDENDFSVLHSVAIEIDMDAFDLETLKWKAPRTYEDGTNWMQGMVILPLAAYMKVMKDKALLAAKDGKNVDDVLAQLDDDRAYLINFIGADDKDHPMFTYFN
jgi:hypothetical protein